MGTESAHETESARDCRFGRSRGSRADARRFSSHRRRGFAEKLRRCFAPLGWFLRNVSGLANVLDATGCSIADAIADAGASANNHGQFISAVAQLTNALRQDNVIDKTAQGDDPGDHIFPTSMRSM